MTVSPKIFIELGQDVSGHLAGNATITNSPGGGSLTLEGRQIGDAISVTDSGNQAHLLMLPTDQLTATGSMFNFHYEFEPTAKICNGDTGRGTLELQLGWDY